MKYINNFKQFETKIYFNDLSSEDEAKKYFDESILQQAKEHDYYILCYMPIDDFLSVCNIGHNDKKYAIVDNLLNNKIKFNEIPYINFTHDNNGNARVIGHEGRHRAKILKSIGVKTIPVLLKSFMEGEGSYAINKDNLKNPPPYFDEEFPKILKGELDNRHNNVPFPIKF
jgi:hypothetical protein